MVAPAVVAEQAVSSEVENAADTSTEETFPTRKPKGKVDVKNIQVSITEFEINARDAINESRGEYTRNLRRGPPIWQMPWKLTSVREPRKHKGTVLSPDPRLPNVSHPWTQQRDLDNIHNAAIARRRALELVQNLLFTQLRQGNIERHMRFPYGYNPNNGGESFS